MVQGAGQGLQGAAQLGETARDGLEPLPVDLVDGRGLLDDPLRLVGEREDTHEELGVRVGPRLVLELRRVARLGGDEFLIVLNQTKNLTMARTIAQKIVTSQQEAIEIQPGVYEKVGISIGIALYPSSADTPATGNGNSRPKASADS